MSNLCPEKNKEECFYSSEKLEESPSQKESGVGILGYNNFSFITIKKNHTDSFSEILIENELKTSAIYTSLI